MKILLYNWVPYDDPRRGGGVTVYLSALIDELAKNYKELDITFLCSGIYYDTEDVSIRYEKIETKTKGVQSYAIINSPVFAPAFLSFYGMRKGLEHTDLKSVFGTFLTDMGPFDIVHFHNLEGLSYDVLSCRQNFPNTRFIYTMHNYYCLCPQVNLWKQERCCCTAEDTSDECIECMTDHVPDDKLRQKMAMTYKLRKDYSEEKASQYAEEGKRLDKIYWDEEHRLLTEDEKQALGEVLSIYRKCYVGAINENIDLVLCVSGRVLDIAAKYGIAREKLCISYIGTKVADNAKNKLNEIPRDGGIAVIFMGYQRCDKGFFFLMDALDKLPKEIAARIDLTVAALGDKESMKRWENFNTDMFRSFVYKNGYTRDEIQSLLENKNLGLIPVLWEDNLPQVAIEMVANGVALMCSDRGGAKELGGDERFVFSAGDAGELCEKISYFTKHPREIVSYFDRSHYQGLMTMNRHINELMVVYGELMSKQDGCTD